MDENDRLNKDLLDFLLRKTAAVRLGVKPGELLPVWRRYGGCPGGAGLGLEDALSLLALPHRELRADDQRALVLFYHPGALTRALAAPACRALLARLGYPAGGGAGELLACLESRFRDPGRFPHEVGLFLGYPAKDVEGFLTKRQRPRAGKTPWVVYGDAQESYRRIAAFRRVEAAAGQLLRQCGGLRYFLESFQSFAMARQCAGELDYSA
ncbi:MAG: DUF3793 family protein [Planctomycetes bacterium]|nr:DUF3793 family protein [Planctomycetota bacterium]